MDTIVVVNNRNSEEMPCGEVVRRIVFSRDSAHTTVCVCVCVCTGAPSPLAAPMCRRQYGATGTHTLKT